MEWTLVGKLDKKTAFKATKKISPIDTLHEAMLKLVEADNITDFGCTKKTNEYFRKQLTAHAKKSFPYWSERYLASSVSMACLNTEPCDVEQEGAKDFHLYVRTESLEDGSVKIRGRRGSKKKPSK